MAVGTTNPLKRLALMYDTTNNIGLVQAMIAGTGTSPLCLNAAGGNVGIGTASPGSPLTVVGTSGSVVFTIGSTNTTLDFQPGSRFGTASPGFTTIDPNGSSPQGVGIWDLFVVNGGCAIGSAYVQTTPPSNGLIVAGNVGIGTTSPPGKLTVGTNGDAESMAVGAWNDRYFCVGQSVSATSSAVAIGFNNTTATGWIYSLAPSTAWRTLNFGAANYNFLCASTNPTLTITNGAVGINKTNPGVILHVFGNGGAGVAMFDNAPANDSTSKGFLNTGTGQRCLAPMWSGNGLYFYGVSNSGYVRFIAGGTNYFTGQHAGVPDNTDIKTNVKDYVGLIVCSNDTGYTSYNTQTNEKYVGAAAISINECLPNITLATKDCDKSVFGVISNQKDNASTNTDGTQEYDETTEWSTDLHDRVRVNSIGEGAIWVSNINGSLENGDYITSSIIPGVGRRQDDDLLHNYTVAKATMSCDFKLNTPKYKSETFQFDGTTYTKAFIGCTYHCG
jgi:hypothetical protein